MTHTTNESGTKRIRKQTYNCSYKVKTPSGVLFWFLLNKIWEITKDAHNENGNSLTEYKKLSGFKIINIFFMSKYICKYIWCDANEQCPLIDLCL